MNRAAQIIQARHRRRGDSAASGWWLRLALVLTTLSVIVGGVIVLLAAYTLAESRVAGVDPGAIELSFSRAGREAHIPLRFYDRNQGQLLVEALNPEAQGRRWYQIDPESPIVLPEHVIQATVAAQEEDYWSADPRPIAQTISA
ncbi:MAG: hypothetical protein PVG02_05690, partial [Anaerolineales bacterium]